MTRHVLASVLTAALAFVLIARADDLGKKDDAKASPAKGGATLDKDDAALKQERLKVQFQDFEAKLLRVKQRLERSSKPEDLEKARVLQRAIDEAGKAGTDNKFDKLVNDLKTSKALDLDTVEILAKKNEDLANDIRAILRILLTDNRDAELAAERRRLEDLLKRLGDVIRQEQVARANTEAGRKDNQGLAKEQQGVTEATKALARAMGKGDGKGDEKNAKGDNKGEGKPGDGKKGDGKEDTQIAKVEPKETKEPRANRVLTRPEPKTDPKKGEEGGSKGEGKKGDGSEKSGAKGGPKPGDQAPKSENKENKPSDSKGKSDGKGKSKGQQGEPKEGQAPKGGSKSGQPKPGQQGQAKNDGKQQPPPDDGDQQPKDSPGKKQVQDAIENQQKAENELKKGDKEKGADEQTQAIDKLKKAQAELEKLLAQLRQEELERLLAALEARCHRMLQMQIAVQSGTVSTHKTIEAAEDKKPTRTEVQKGLKLEDDEREIVKEAKMARRLLETEGSAVAFPEVFAQLESDMNHVADLLHLTEVGFQTQTIEQDIIDTLKEMIEALKKQQQDLKNKNSKPGQQGPPQDQKLIELLAELKMIRSLQIRVNSRTKTYAQEYQGEQAPAPGTVQTPQEKQKAEMVQKYMKELADRQLKIFEVTNNIAKGKNEGGRP